MLPLQARVPGPRWPATARHRGLVQVPAVQHAHVVPAREIVHVDPERRVGGCTEGGRTRGRLYQREEVGSEIDGPHEDRV